MAHHSSAARLAPGPLLSVPDGMRRAVAELATVRSGMEVAFETVHAHADHRAHHDADYLIAMQSIDALSQQVAAIERFILNLSELFSNEVVIEISAAAAGITLAAVATRLTSESGADAHDSGDCDFF